MLFSRSKLLMITATVIAMFICIIGSYTVASEPDIKLRFKPEKTFKIVQFTDTQDDDNIDPRTVKLMDSVLNKEKPDLVIFTGDNISGRIKNVEAAKKAIDNVAHPVNNRHIPWLITFGNHDRESNLQTGLNANTMLDIYMSYDYNINKQSPEGVNGTGNINVLIYDSKGEKPIFNIWALDSGMSPPKTINGKPSGLSGYDWIRPSQINWYYNTSMKLEEENKKKIPALMFFHIPLIEFAQMWNSKERYNVTGERNEPECPGAINSGLFSTLWERGDVKGVFVGHDHSNNYVGNFCGIMLGYSANTGFGIYGASGVQPNRLRGARVFNLDEDNLNTVETHMVYARDFGIQ